MTQNTKQKKAKTKNKKAKNKKAQDSKGKNKCQETKSHLRRRKNGIS